MIISLSDLVSMCKIQDLLSNEVRKANYHTYKRIYQQAAIMKEAYTVSGKKVLRTLIHLLNIPFVEGFFGFLIQVFQKIPKTRDSWQSVPECVVRVSILRTSEKFTG